MNDSMPPPARSDHDSLRLRHVLTIVLAGAVLGVGFNALQLSAGSSRGLAWVKRERTVVSLEGRSQAPRGTTADTARRVEVSARQLQPTGLPKPVTPANAAAGAPVSSAAQSTPAAARSIPAAARSTPAAAQSTPAAAPSSPTAASAPSPAPEAPAIPDSREPIEVGLDVARKFHASGAALFLDARSAQEYAEGHVAGAVSLPFDDVFKNPALAKAVAANGRVLITYCGGGECDLSRNLAFSLIDSGFRKVLVFKDGLPAWVSAGESVRRGAQP